MAHITDMQDKTVLVTFKNYFGEVEFQFEGKVFDINVENEVLWVERIENGELIDTYDVHLQNPRHSVMIVETIEEVKQIEVTTDKEMKEIKKELFKAIKYLDDVSIAVKVYDCFENTISFDGSNDQTYDVEINYYVEGEYVDGFYNQTFVGRFRDDEEAEKMAMKRAKAVLRTVKGWFDGSEIEVKEGVEVYNA